MLPHVLLGSCVISNSLIIWEDPHIQIGQIYFFIFCWSFGTVSLRVSTDSSLLIVPAG